jgi:hypothetical protein
LNTSNDKFSYDDGKKMIEKKLFSCCFLMDAHVNCLTFLMMYLVTLEGVKITSDMSLEKYGNVIRWFFNCSRKKILASISQTSHLKLEFDF